MSKRLSIPKIIAIGSKNPTKINAVKTVISELGFEKIEIVSKEVNSLVSLQPRSDEETRQGAINRATAALDSIPKAEWGVGIEGGVREIKYFYRKNLTTEIIETAWCAIIDRKGNIALGGGAEFQLPPIITAQIKKGKELGPTADELLGRKEIRKEEGVIGVFSNNFLTRQVIYEQLVRLALVKIIDLSQHKNWWKQ